MNKIPFLAMFFEYKPSEDLLVAVEQAEIIHAQIRREQRRLNLTISFLQYVSPELLLRLEEELGNLYGLKAVEILPQFPREEFTKLDGRELSRMMVKEYSPCSAILA